MNSMMLVQYVCTTCRTVYHTEACAESCCGPWKLTEPKRGMQLLSRKTDTIYSILATHEDWAWLLAPHGCYLIERFDSVIKMFKLLEADKWVKS